MCVCVCVLAADKIAVSPFRDADTRQGQETRGRGSRELPVSNDKPEGPFAFPELNNSAATS